MKTKNNSISTAVMVMLLVIFSILQAGVVQATPLIYTEGEFLYNVFKQYGVNMNETGPYHKAYYDIANRYNWGMLEGDFDKKITIGKASRILVLSQGEALSEDDALQKIKMTGYLPSIANSSDPVTPYELNLIRRYIDTVKPLKIFKPVISEQRRAQLVNQYKTAGYKINADLEYSPFNDYLHWGSDGLYNFTLEYGNMKLDAAGIPQIKYNGILYYNPLTVAQYALALHGVIDANYQDVNNYDYYARFIGAVDKLLSLMDPKTGAFNMPFTWSADNNGIVLYSGWVSAVVQAQSLSVFSRAYRLTHDSKYLIAGNKSLYYMSHPMGGVQTTLKDISPILNNYIFFDAYPFFNSNSANPSTYTLDDFMYSILGFYDWWQIQPDEISGNHAVAKAYFDKSMETLRYILPLYDLGGYAAYDLSHITYNKEPYIAVGYMKPYVELLGAIYSITNDPWINYYKNLWLSYIK